MASFQPQALAKLKAMRNRVAMLHGGFGFVIPAFTILAQVASGTDDQPLFRPCQSHIKQPVTFGLFGLQVAFAGLGQGAGHCGAGHVPQRMAVLHQKRIAQVYVALRRIWQDHDWRL